MDIATMMSPPLAPAATREIMCNVVRAGALSAQGTDSSSTTLSFCSESCRNRRGCSNGLSESKRLSKFPLSTMVAALFSFLTILMGVGVLGRFAQLCSSALPATLTLPGPRDTLILRTG